MTTLTDKLKADVAGARERLELFRAVIELDPNTDPYWTDSLDLLTALDTALTVIEALEAEHEEGWCITYQGQDTKLRCGRCRWCKAQAAITAALEGKA